ncbi:hypothetical protein HPB50_007757 [Hyalomma asiaticum]|uniref:Uncharacterized protein n=1 Tax=Hyalomma asiaticum TaxID=266040 RepID=A0ACB7TED8_HYAAI|nr:hypothetical protein HPB50_007757 [Hyalomma asiaticum]
MTEAAKIVHYARSCTNLTYLSCIGCQVNPAEVLTLIRPESLLDRIEWSLFGLEVHPTVCADIAAFDVTNPEAEEPKLLYMYVELPSIESDDILHSILLRCKKVARLHIHVKKGGHYATINRCGDIAAGVIQSVCSFTYSQEETVSRQSGCPYRRFDGKPHANRTLKIAASLLGNMTIHGPPCKVNCVFLSDVMGNQETVTDFKQLLLAIKDPNDVSAAELSVASKLDCWSKLRSLALTLVPPKSSSRLPLLGDVLAEPLRSLLASCRSVTELNLSTVHFKPEVDCCKILAAALPTLQALAVAPCGVSYSDSVDRLAKHCVRLEELEVLVLRDSASAFCKACSLPLVISERSMAALQQRSKLRRVSLRDIQHIPSFDFLRACRLIELRICAISWNEDMVYRGFGELLCANHCLYSFTFMYNKLHLECDEFRREIMRATHLRILSIYPGLPIGDNVVQKFIEELTSNMPRLEVLHLHYKSLTGNKNTLSWIVNECGAQTRGVTLTDRPCIFCDRSTYIGLARAHNRKNVRF